MSEPPVQGRAAAAVKRQRSFVAEFLRNPAAVGSIAPSSKGLAREMVARSRIAEAKVVVEYGPGTGAFTADIIAALAPGAKYFAIELSAALADEFRRRHPELQVYTASVSEISRLLAAQGLAERDAIDVIISGLPWAAFPMELQHELLAATVAALKPGGEMLTFAYAGISSLSPAGRRLRRMLPRFFSRVEKGRTVLGNLPPAFVYRCVK